LTRIYIYIYIDFSRVQSRLNTEFPIKPVAKPVAQVQTQPSKPINKPPKSESSTSSKWKKPSKKDLKEIALAFMQQFTEASDDEENEEEGFTAESSTHLSQLQFDHFLG
jgi:hypothetical protein